MDSQIFNSKITMDSQILNSATMDPDIFGSNLIEGVPRSIEIPDPFLAMMLSNSDEMFMRKPKKSSWKRTIIWKNDPSDSKSATSGTSKISFESDNNTAKKQRRMRIQSSLTQTTLRRKRSSRSDPPKRKKFYHFLSFRVLMPLLCAKSQ